MMRILLREVWPPRLVGDFAPALLSPLTSVISDRVNRKRVMITCELAAGRTARRDRVDAAAAVIAACLGGTAGDVRADLPACGTAGDPRAATNSKSSTNSSPTVPGYVSPRPAE